MHTQKLDDSVLVSNYIEGNERSLEILIMRHKQRIFSFIYQKYKTGMLLKIFFRILL